MTKETHFASGEYMIQVGAKLVCSNGCWNGKTAEFYEVSSGGRPVCTSCGFYAVFVELRNDDLDSMRCPACGQTITRKQHDEPFVCECGWKSTR